MKLIFEMAHLFKVHPDKVVAGYVQDKLRYSYDYKPLRIWPPAKTRKRSTTNKGY